MNDGVVGVNGETIIPTDEAGKAAFGIEEWADWQLSIQGGCEASGQMGCIS